MNTQIIRLISFLLIITALSCRSAGVTMKEDEPLLSVGHFFTEEEGRQFLDEVREQYQTAEEWKTRAKKIRQQILRGSDLKPFPEKTPLNPIIGDIRVYEGYTVRNVAFESLPGVFVTGSLYAPIEPSEQPAGILGPHGHWTQPGEVGRYRPDAQKRYATLARMGALVLGYDLVGYGQLGEMGWEHNHPESFKLQLWNNIRAVDFLIEMGADPSRIASSGASGGGSQTFFLAAVDERVSVSVPVVMVSAHFFGGCVCESGMPIHRTRDFQTNNVEIAALAAPRPLLLVSVGGDWTKNTPEVEFPHIQHIYRLLSHPGNVENAHFPEEEHTYGYSKRAAVYPFMARHLGLDLSKVQNPDGSFNEEDIVIEEQEALYPFDENHPFPAHGILHNDQVVWNP